MPLHNIYLIHSDEPLLNLEATHEIEEIAEQEGVLSIERHTADARFDWPNFLDALRQVDLFSEKKLVILQLASPKLNAQNSDVFLNYLNQAEKIHILLLVSPKLDNTTSKSKWVTAITQQGKVIQCRPPELSNFPQWLAARCQKMGIQLSSVALTLIAENCEGNLSAAAQILEKLFLQHGQNKISDTHVENAVIDTTRYSVFDLADAWLSSDRKRSYKILQSLKSSAAEPTLVLWALLSECRTLSKISFDLEKGDNIQTAMNTHRVWKKRESLVKQHLQTKSDYTTLLQKLLKLEQVIKGAKEGNFWDEVENFILGITPC